MLDKTKYTKTHYLQNEREKRIAINSKHFKSMTMFHDNICEVVSGHPSIRLEVSASGMVIRYGESNVIMNYKIDINFIIEFCRCQTLLLATF